MAQKLIKSNNCANGFTGLNALDAINDNFLELYSGAGGGGGISDINVQSDNYTLTLADVGKLIDMTKASGSNLTVPPNSSVAIPINSIITIKRSHASGLVTFVQGAGVTITPSSGSLVDAGHNVYVTLVKTGTDTWDLQNGSANAWSTYTPVFTGFSADPSTTGWRYNIIGKTCFVHGGNSGNGTSNATTFTMTLPAAAAVGLGQQHTQIVVDNGTFAIGRVIISSGSNIMTVNATVTGGAFTASGNKGIRMWLTYEIA